MIRAPVDKIRDGLQRYPRCIGDVSAQLLVSWFQELNVRGGLTTALADGEDLVVYADRRGNGEAWVCELLPPHGEMAFGDKDLTVI